VRGRDLEMMDGFADLLASGQAPDPAGHRAMTARPGAGWSPRWSPGHYLAAAGRAPTLIGAWNEDGTQVEGYALNEAEWLAVAPDELDTTDPDNPVPVRPTAFREIHGWAGWGEKQLP
uniref:hypothetical protein n=1 Tax=uncultured Arenimonas sp. TaxID=546226 RepID=UPI0030DB2C8C